MSEMRDGWSFDMSTAPRGATSLVKRLIGKNEVEVEQHQPVTIFAAGADGATVTPTKWLPKEERWSMFTKANPPIAWKPWPSHPAACEVQA